MNNVTSAKAFWIPFLASSLVMLGVGVSLHDWLAALLIVFICLALSIGVAFNKCRPRIAGAYGGAVTGLGLSLLFLFFGPIQFYG